MFNARETALILLKEQAPICLVSIVETRGSVPRDAGTQMLVTIRKIYGSIGGGNLEMQAIDSARKILETKSGPQEYDYILGPDMEQCCGGQVKLSLRIIDDLTGLTDAPAKQTPLYLFGAGHVGSALIHALTPLPFDLYCFDNRPDKTNDTVSHLTDIKTSIEGAPDNALYLVMTHDHALDYDLVAAILKKNIHYCGMIGSKTKRARFLSRLKKDGLTPTQISRLTCPIGIEGIQGKEPEIIAASAAAQLLKIRDKYEH